MKTYKNHIYRLVSLSFVVSFFIFISACGNQEQNHVQMTSGTQKTLALPADIIHNIHYVAKEATCGGQIPCYTGIQEAINDASTGDTVQVFAGKYDENISLKSGVVVQGAGAATTTLYGKLAGSVVTAIDIDSLAKLDGFTLSGGLTLYSGGGVYSKGSSLTLSNLIITGNTARCSGGGIIIEHGAPKIFNVSITGNMGINGGGGGMYIDHSSPIITNVTITGNNGGGIYNYGSSPTITNAVISGNSAVFGGGIVNKWGSSPTIYNSVISKNTATQYGGGIYNYLSSAPTIVNCIIAENTAVRGGGIYSSAGDSVMLVQNSIIAFNSGGGIFADTPVTSNYNDVWLNDYSKGIPLGENDISADPKFVNSAEGDYRLQPVSPCIDAGNNAVVTGVLSTDLYGNPRMLDGNDDWTTVVDMGAAEYLIPLTLQIDTPVNGVALQDNTAFQATTTGAQSVEFFVRQPDGTEGIPIGYDNLTASFNVNPVIWSLPFNTLDLQDGYYFVFAKARNVIGQEVRSETVTFTIRNWASISLLPSTQVNNAGRTMPVKFAIRVDAAVDPSQPFVHNESMKVMIYKSENPTYIQTSYFGGGATEYRIDDIGQIYITNFKTEKHPATYTVLIMRPGFVVDKFTFETVM